MIRCVIIEDEPIARKGMINLIDHEKELELINVSENIADFLAFLSSSTNKPDLMFLDVEMPGLSGIRFLREHKPDFPVILTTAYSQYALEGYELNVIDYLLKPISKARFSQSVKKSMHYLEYLNKSTLRDEGFIFIRSEKIIEKIIFDELYFVESLRNYVIYHTVGKKFISYNSLKNVETSLPSDRFIKIQKSFIINKTLIQKIEKGNVFISNRCIPISRENKLSIIDQLIGK